MSPLSPVTLSAEARISAGIPADARSFAFLYPIPRLSAPLERLNLTQEVLRTASSEEWLQRLEAHDVPCAPVLRRREVIHHPQVVANQTIVEIDHPQAGRLRQARPATQFSETPIEYRHGAPTLGEHSHEVLSEAGLPEEEIEALKAAGVVVTNGA